MKLQLVAVVFSLKGGGYELNLISEDSWYSSRRLTRSLPEAWVPKLSLAYGLANEAEFLLPNPNVQCTFFSVSLNI